MKLLLYCTKSKPYLIHENGDYDYNNMSCSYDCYSVVDKQYLTAENIKALNGKIVAECDFEVSKIELHQGYYNYGTAYFTKRENPFRYFSYRDLLLASCVQDNAIRKYLGPKGGYAIHIKNLHIFEKPREINDLVLLNQPRKDLPGTQYNVVKVAPQNMCSVDYNFISIGKYQEHIFSSPYILISIKPEWLCKILNGEKTIEIRKKVLKEMLNKENNK